MQRERTIHVTTPNGVEHELEVHFSIDSFGTSDSYYEPGDPVEIVIEEIFLNSVDGVEQPNETRVTDWAYATFYSWNVAAVRVPDYRPQTRMRKALFGAPVTAYDKPGQPRTFFTATVETFRTRPQTVAEYLEETILENIHDYQDEEPDYDYSC